MMPSHPFMQVDAFTTMPLGGNPCAIVFEADDLDAQTMQAIARENNLSETAFVLRSEKADVRARYFTPDEEIPLAGHPTIATIYALVTTGRVAASPPVSTITLELLAGVIPVEVQWHEGEVSRVIMTQLKPRFMTIHDPKDVMPLFGLTADDLLPGHVIQTVSTGTPQLMIPVRDHEALRRISPDGAAYDAYRAQSDFFSPHTFCLGGVTEHGDTFARHVLSSFEDPFTGSATGGMAAYLWHYGLLDRPIFNAEQGHWMGRPGQATVEVIGPRHDIETVRVGGSAVTVLRGELLL